MQKKSAGIHSFVYSTAMPCFNSTIIAVVIVNEIISGWPGTKLFLLKFWFSMAANINVVSI